MFWKLLDDVRAGKYGPMPSQPIASWTTPCSSRNDTDSGTRTRRQIIGLIPGSRTLSCRIVPGSAADFTDSMTENYALPHDSIKVDPPDFGTSNYDGCSTYGGGGKGRFRKRTVPVGSFPSNSS